MRLKAFFPKPKSDLWLERMSVASFPITNEEDSMNDSLPAETKMSSLINVEVRMSCVCFRKDNPRSQGLLPSPF